MPSESKTSVPAESVIAWLEEFAAGVRTLNYAGTKRLFCEDVFGYGTRAHAYQNLDDLERTQWRQVWPNTSGFQFDFASLRLCYESSETFCFIGCEWHSDGVRQDGSRFPRQGRCTIVLRRDDPQSKWHGAHTHFSLRPEAAASVSSG